MRKISFSYFLILLFLMASLSLTGCNLFTNSTQIGDCTLNVAFLNVLTNDSSTSFQNIEEDIRENVEIRVELENIVTEKKYEIKLNPDNSYLYTAKLFPGTYRVMDVEATMSDYTGMHLAAGSEVVELARGTTQNLSIYIDNEEEFAIFQNNLIANDEIVMSGKFSRNIFIDGDIINIQDIINYLDIESTSTVKPYAKCELTSESKGIIVTVLNDSSSTRNWQECKVIAIEVAKSTVIMPGGITLGMQANTVCNKDTGIYGEPTGFEGVAMYGQGIGDLYAVYLDPESGDKMMLEIDSIHGFVTGVKYELEVFE